MYLFDFHVIPPVFLSRDKTIVHSLQNFICVSRMIRLKKITLLLSVTNQRNKQAQKSGGIVIDRYQLNGEYQVQPRQRTVRIQGHHIICEIQIFTALIVLVAGSRYVSIPPMVRFAVARPPVRSMT